MIRVQVKVSGHLDYRTQIEELQKKVSDLSGRLQSTMAQLEEARRSLDLMKNALEEERRQRAAIQAELDKTRAELQRTREILDVRERMISELRYELAKADERASTYLRWLQLTVGVAVVAAVVPSILLLRRRRSSTITVPATQPLEQQPSSEELEIRRLTTEGEGTGHMAEETVSRKIVDERRNLMVSKYLDFLQKLELAYRDGRIKKEVYERLRSEYLGRLKELGYDTTKLEQQG
jgi:chromosome segregation ATPase